MRICLVTPAPAHSYHGNRVTAVRWADILRGQGHEVAVAQDYHDQPADLLVALHARRSAESLRRFRARHADAPVVLALTGTDLYPELTEADQSVLQLADRLVVLQRLGVRQLPAELRARARVVYQSAPPLPSAPPPSHDHFDVVLLAHLRPVKDPLLAAAAARLLPAGSRVRIRHAGTVIDRELGERAARENRDNPGYRWVGELPRSEALRLLAGSRLLLLTSRHEGGANTISEALAAGVPVLSTRIPGTVGILGADYPGYFPVGDPARLAQLLVHAETDEDWYQKLHHQCTALRTLVAPERERESWQQLLAELAPPRSTGKPTGPSCL
ncbi:MAG TPA: selenoneine biosynthesis selenosugar synthase SenB [Pseudonocardiaceae bacterium]|nr:selenoneine biosynthesis selenosugar synthase SenB [Pseudonocardiaceae bacterium]